MKRCLLVLILLLLSPAAATARARISATPAQKQLLLGESILVTVSVESTEQGNPELLPPRSPDFRIEGHSTESRFEFSFGSKARRSLKQVFQLRPTRAGPIVVGPFVYRSASGTIASSQPFTLLVKEPPPPPQGEADLDPDARLTALMEVTPETLYLGQQAMLTITRYSREYMSQCGAAPPRIEGAWFDDLLDRAPRAKVVTLGGVDYEKGLLQRYALFPIRTGVLEIPGVEVKCTIRGTGFFRGGSEPLTSQSAKVRLDVLPLPSEGCPKGFGGAVGRFVLKAQLDRQDLRQGEPVTLSLSVEGQGNFKGFKLPQPRLPEGVRSYPPTVSDDIAYDQRGKLRGRKTMELILVPLRAGKLSMPSFAFPYFDPDSRGYRVARSRAFHLEVKPRQKGERVVRMAGRGEDEAGGGLPELRPLRPGGHRISPRSRLQSPLISHPLFWLSLLVPAAIFASTSFARLLRRSREQNRARTSFRTARKRALRRLDAASKQSGDAQRSWAEAVAALHGYLQDRTAEPTIGHTREELERALVQEHGYPRDLVTRLTEFLEEADLARFGGVSSDTDPGAALRQARGLLDELDRHRPHGPTGQRGEAAP